MSFSFDPAALNAILAQPAPQARMAVYAQPDLLRLAKENCSVPFPGGSARNPAPGYNDGTAVYMRGDRSKTAPRAPGQFRDTLQLEITAGGELSFFSPATSDRGGFAYGQALIDGRAPFIGPYRLLPPEYYT
jgi:hypothetical protein